MTATTSTVAPPRQRWHQSRKLRYGVALIAICVAGYFLLPWLLMSGDLRRLQGTWRIVRIEIGGLELRENPQFDDAFIFAGNRLTNMGAGGQATFFVDLEPDQRKMTIYDGEEIDVLGLKFRVPAWVRRPSRERHGRAFLEMDYELDDSRLVLRYPTPNGEQVMHLERQ